MSTGKAVLSMQADPGTTKAITLTDAWQLLTTAYADDGTISNANAVIISCETNDMRIAWGSVTPDATAGHIIYNTDMQRFVGRQWITQAWVKNAAAGSNASMKITPEY